MAVESDEFDIDKGGLHLQMHELTVNTTRKTLTPLKKEDIDLLAVAFYCQCLHKNSVRYFHSYRTRAFHGPYHEKNLEVSLLDRHDS